MNPGSALLTVGGALSAAAAALHLAVIVGGPDWYRFLGAGEGMARAAERGSWTPPLVTIGIAIILLVWAAYAFSGAGLIRRLPLLRTGLIVIGAIYLARGFVIFAPSMLRRPDLSSGFLFWSSLIVLGLGLVYATGTWMSWPNLSYRNML